MGAFAASHASAALVTLVVALAGPAHLLIVAVLSAGFVPLEPSLLAPGPDDFARALERTTSLVDESEVVGRALERLHNRWAELAVAGKLKSACASDEARSIAARSRVFGAAHRDAVQAARAAGRRLQRILSAPTVVPALDPRAQQRADRVRVRVDDEVRRWVELRAWHHRHVEPAVKSCAARLVLANVAGLASTLACGTGECREPAAIVGIGGGRICPGGLPADGRVVIAPDGRACHGAATCECAPEPVQPGAVIGP